MDKILGPGMLGRGYPHTCLWEIQGTSCAPSSLSHAGGVSYFSPLSPLDFPRASRPAPQPAPPPPPPQQSWVFPVELEAGAGAVHFQPCTVKTRDSTPGPEIPHQDPGATLEVKGPPPWGFQAHHFHPSQQSLILTFLDSISLKEVEKFGHLGGSVH